MMGGCVKIYSINKIEGVSVPLKEIVTISERYRHTESSRQLLIVLKQVNALSQQVAKKNKNGDTPE